MKIVLWCFCTVIGAAMLLPVSPVRVSIDLRSRETPDEEIAAKMKKAGVPGLAVVFLNNGEVGWTGYFGFANFGASAAFP